MLGLPPPPTAAAMPPSMPAAPPQLMAPPSSGTMSIGGIMPVTSLKAMMETQRRETERKLDAQQSQAIIQGLAGHVKKVFHRSEEARRPIENMMIEAMYARRGEYTAEKLKQIQANRQPAIYMMVASAKMRQIESLLRDVLLGSGSEKPWTIGPTPNPKLPPELRDQIMQALMQEVQQAIMMGLEPSVEEVRQRMRLYREQLTVRVREEAQIRCERMEQKMEDQLAEGNFPTALDDFITDLATFKTAFMAGPIVRKKPKLTWSDGGEAVVEDELVLEWERVDPFDMYPAPWARHINEGPLIRRHKLTREALGELKGVEGYSVEAIDKVIDLYGSGGLNNWLNIDSERARAEGKEDINVQTNTDLIDAIQYWGSASGKMLIEWGMEADQVPEPTKEYQIEAWVVGPYVIKAVMNADPLSRRPYYALSYQRVPGSVWGNAPYDLMRDCQDMCNAAARSLAANLGISSGPQVAVLSNRLPSGEDITEMYPWKIWQFESDPMGGTAAPVTFFQPNSNASELMTVYERFSQMADEYTGIPRYMAGFNEGSGGAGRTASGMSMMIGNASKIIKQVVGSIDTHILSPLLQRLFYYNMKYGDDADLKGDVQIIARGALSLQVKEAAQVRLNEFLAATGNPVDMQIIGMEGRGELLRHAVKRLDVNPDKVVPPVQIIKERAAMAQMAMAQQQAAQNDATSAKAERDRAQAQQPTDGSEATNNRQTLQNGEAVTDNFQPA